MTISNRRFFHALSIAYALVVLGCGRQPADSSPQTSVPLDNLQQQLDDSLDYTLYERQLNTREHGAWQVLHGVLTYQQDFPVRVGNTDSVQSAILYLMNGGTVDGWEMRPGSQLENGRTGLRAVMQPGTKRGQGHADQWLAIIAQCGFPMEKEIIVEGLRFTIGDLIGQVQLDVSDNMELEYSWTLIGLALYLPSDASWTANDGETWSIERLIEIELDQDLNDSACGGTHRLIGVSMALNEYRKAGGELTGVWANADSRIQTAIRVARETQNADGSFSPNYFARPGQTADMATQLAATGHILEFLAISMSENELKKEWVQAAAANLCRLFDETKKISLECGALYHAAHGLALYRQRIFGEREYKMPQYGG